MRPVNLKSHRDDLIILSSFLLILITGFLIEGLRLGVTQPAWKNWSPAGAVIANVLSVAGMTDRKYAELASLLLVVPSAYLSRIYCLYPIFETFSSLYSTA